MTVSTVQAWLAAAGGCSLDRARTAAEVGDGLGALKAAAPARAHMTAMAAGTGTALMALEISETFRELIAAIRL